jgi:hypothetical protein
VCPHHRAVHVVRLPVESTVAVGGLLKRLEHARPNAGPRPIVESGSRPCSRGRSARIDRARVPLSGAPAGSR